MPIAPFQHVDTALSLYLSVSKSLLVEVHTDH